MLELGLAQRELLALAQSSRDTDFVFANLEGPGLVQQRPDRRDGLCQRYE